MFSKFNSNIDALEDRLDQLYTMEKTDTFVVKDDIQSKFVLTGNYEVNTNAVQVYSDGSRVFDFTELSSNSILLNNPVIKGTIVRIIYNAITTKDGTELSKILSDYETFLSTSDEIVQKVNSVTEDWNTSYKEAIDKFTESVNKLETEYEPKIAKLESMIGTIESNATLISRVNALNDIKTSKEYVDNLYNSLASGTPYGKFNSLSDLNSKFPTGDNHSYIINTDLYYYDNISKQWINNGPFVGTSNSDNSVKLSMRTPLGNQAYISYSDGPVKFDSSTKGIVDSSNCSILYGNVMHRVLNQVISASTNDTIIAYTPSDDTIRIVDSTLASIDDSYLVLGHINYDNNTSFLNGDYLIDGKLPFTENKLSDVKHGQITLVNSQFITLTDDGSTINVILPELNVITSSSIISTSDSKLSWNYTEGTSSSVYVDPTTKTFYYDNVLSSDTKNSSQLVYLFTYYNGKIFSVNDTSLFTVNNDTNGGWVSPIKESFDRSATYVSGNSVKVVINPTGEAIVTIVDDHQFLSYSQLLKVPSHQISFTVSNQDEGIWIYADSNNSNVLLYKTAESNSIQAESKPVLLFTILGRKVYGVSDSFRNTIEVNGIEDGGWNNPDQLSMVGLIDDGGNLSINFTDTSLSVTLSSQNQDNQQEGLVGTQILKLPYLTSTFDITNPNSFKILGYDSKNLKLVLYDSDGNSDINFNDTYTYALAYLYNQHIVKAESKTLQLSIVNDIKQGGWDSSKQMNWDTNELIVPDNVYMLKGISYSILPQNCNLNSINDTLIEFNDITETKVSDGNSDISIHPELEGSFVTDMAEIHNENPRNAIKKNFKLNIVDASSLEKKSINILVIGDENSIGTPYYLSSLIPKLTSKNITPTMIGTMNNQLLDVGSSLGEARPGWRWTDFTNSTIGGNPLVSSEVDKNNSNPFINPKTSKFDFSYYMTQQKFNSIDFVLINLGYNDLMNKSIFGGSTSISTEDIYSNTTSSINTIESSIHSYNSKAKVAIIPPVFAGILSTDYHDLNSKYIKYLLNNEQSNTKISLLGNYLSTGIRNGKLGSSDSGMNVIFSSKNEALPMSYADNPSNSRINSLWSASWILNNL